MRKRKVYATMAFLMISTLIATVLLASAAPAVVLTPTSGEPGDPVGVDGTGFAVSTSVGIGFGPEVAVTDESVTTTHPDLDTYSGFTAHHPITLVSFNWIADIGGVLATFCDNGDGTLGTTGFAMSFSVINYTTGFFSRTMQSAVEFEVYSNYVNYTTYEFDVTPAGLATDDSGVITGQFTVPAIWNETHTVTVIDEKGNVGTSDFTVFGSDIVPEALTIGVVVLLSSVAVVIATFSFRKRAKNFTKLTKTAEKPAQ